MYQINFHQSIPVTGNPSVFHLRALVEERSKFWFHHQKTTQLQTKHFTPVGFRLLISKMRKLDEIVSRILSRSASLCFYCLCLQTNFWQYRKSYSKMSCLQMLSSTKVYTHKHPHPHIMDLIFFVYFCCRKLKLFLFFLLSVSDGTDCINTHFGAQAL